MSKENIINEIEQNNTLSIEQVETILSKQVPVIDSLNSFPGDPNATWVYWLYTDTAERGVPDEWVWERLRMRRNNLLSDCDFRVVSDAPWNTDPWIEYRQALRDLPNNTNDPRQAVWPTEPEP